MKRQERLIWRAIGFTLLAIALFQLFGCTSIPDIQEKMDAGEEVSLKKQQKVWKWITKQKTKLDPDYNCPEDNTRKFRECIVPDAGHSTPPNFPCYGTLRSLEMTGLCHCKKTGKRLYLLSGTHDLVEACKRW